MLLLWCAYITVHPETHAADNGIFVAQQMCHIMILFQNGSSIKNEINKNLLSFCHVLNN
jgi:hypothetical protein